MFAAAELQLTPEGQLKWFRNRQDVWVYFQSKRKGHTQYSLTAGEHSWFMLEEGIHAADVERSVRACVHGCAAVITPPSLHEWGGRVCAYKGVCINWGDSSTLGPAGAIKQDH